MLYKKIYFESIPKIPFPIKKQDIKDAFNYLNHISGDTVPEKIFYESLYKSKVKPILLSSIASGFQGDNKRRPKADSRLYNPIIVGITSNYKPIILDGNHRYFQHKNMGEKKIWALVINMPWLIKRKKFNYFGINYYYDDTKINNISSDIIILNKKNLLIKKAKSKNFNLIFTNLPDYFGGATWLWSSINKNGPKTIIQADNRILNSFNILDEKELNKFWFDKFYGLLPHEKDESEATFMIFNEKWNKLKSLYPYGDFDSIYKILKKNFPEKINISNLKQLINNTKWPNIYESIAGEAHDLIISSNKDNYYKYNNSIMNKLDI